jgi:Domain of unknown function (DUF4340)
MSPKLFLGTAAVTAIAVVAAVFAVIGETEIRTVGTSNEPAFAELRKNPDAAAKVILRDAHNTFTLDRGSDGRWIAPDKFDYRADSAKVRDLVVKMADMELIEPKTDRPDRYHRLGVEDLDAEDAQSRLVRLESQDGTVLAEALFGKAYNHKTGPANSGIYMRRVGAERAWLASSDLTLDVDINKWLDRTIVDLAASDVRKVAMKPQASQPYAVERSQAGGDFHVADLPEDIAIKQTDVNRLSSALAGLTFQDVKPKDQMTWPEASDTAKFETFDKLGVEVRLAKVGDTTWIAVSAAYLGDEADQGDGAAAARGTADDINKHAGSWVYQISEYAADRLRLPLDKLLEDKSGTS